MPTTATTDTYAKQLFARANPIEDWPNVDECVRLHYRLEAEKNLRDFASAAIKKFPKILAKLAEGD